MSLNVVKSKHANIENVVFKEPKVNPKYGNVSVPIAYKNKDGNPVPFVMQMPPLKAFVGYSTFEGDNSVKISLPLSIHELETNPRHKELCDFFEKFDKLVVDKVFSNPKWIKKNKNTSREVIVDKYHPCLRFPVDKETNEITDKYPPNLKLKIMTNQDGTVRTKVFNPDKTPVDNPNEAVVKGAIVSSLMECTGMWVVGGKFGVSFRAVQLMIKSVPQRDAFAFQDDSDDEDDLEEDSESSDSESE